MKTVLEWFEQAKKEGHPWVDAAIRNSDNLKGENPDLATALAAAFVWKNSPENDEYWRKIYHKLKNESYLDKLKRKLIKLCLKMK